MTTKEYLKEKENFYFEVPKALTCSPSEKEKHKANIIAFNQKLIKKYPWLKIPYREDSEEDLKTSGSFYEITMMDFMPDGWRLAFGDKMCEEIDKELREYNFEEKYKVLDIKEKYGSLRWYDGGYPVGKLSETYVEASCKSSNREELRSQYPFSDYSWKEAKTEHYIPFDSEEAKSLNLKDLINYNKEAITFYKIYKIVKRCKIPKIINKYTKKSENICVLCGDPAKWILRSWISPYCDKCASSYMKHNNIREFTENRFKLISHN